ncbi:MAG: murein biosynthesis integral membrane protein MurJ [Chloroflexi bacterium]|nr:murein biosynthesis integral membrane protein MurJ [Chloroflexota bacterium]
MNGPPLARAALVLSLGNVGSRILGLAREQVIAGLFGAVAATDAFRVSSRVPLALYDLLVGGMVSSALVPVFSSYLAAGRRRELGELWGSLAGLALLILAGAAAALALAAPLLVDVLAAGYPPDVRDLSVELLRFLLPSLVFMGLSGLLMALLYAQRHFGLPALALMAYNLGVVVAGLALYRAMGIFSLALGVLAGAGLQMALQASDLRGLPVRLALNLQHPGVARVLRLYLPVALGLVVSTLGIAVDTNLASRTGEGNLAAMGFATTLVQFPLGLVAAAVSAAMLPDLARHAEALGTPGDPGAHDTALTAYRQALAQGLKLVLVTIIPATLGLLALREPLVRLLFQRGAFDATAAQRTSVAFLAYAPGLPAAAVDQVLISGFYARQQTLQPVLVGVMGVGVYLAVGLALLAPLGMPGLALANSAQWVAHMAVMLLLTHRGLGGLQGLGLRATLLRSLAASGVMLATLRIAGWLIPPDAAAGAPALALSLALALLAAALGYLGALARIGPAEARLLASALRTRLATGGPGSVAP